MAIYHCSVKTISRSAGRSGTASAAYRSGEKITDERTGEIFDYTRRQGVESAELHLPEGAPDWAHDRQELWNAAEQAEKRKNSTVAREFELALPVELNAQQRKELVDDFSRELVERHGFAVDACIHEPHREGDERNHHAHLLATTRRLKPEGFTEKTRELDDKKTGPAEVTMWRERWAEHVNEALERVGSSERVDHRSLKEQREEALARGNESKAKELDREPMRHLGPAATNYERRTGETSWVRQSHIEEATQRLEKAKSEGEKERAKSQHPESVISLSTDIGKAVQEKEGAASSKSFYESMKERHQGGSSSVETSKEAKRMEGNTEMSFYDRMKEAQSSDRQAAQKQLAKEQDSQDAKEIPPQELAPDRTLKSDEAKQAQVPQEEKIREQKTSSFFEQMRQRDQARQVEHGKSDEKGQQGPEPER